MQVLLLLGRRRFTPQLEGVFGGVVRENEADEGRRHGRESVRVARHPVLQVRTQERCGSQVGPAAHLGRLGAQPCLGAARGQAHESVGGERRVVAQQPGLGAPRAIGLAPGQKGEGQRTRHDHG